jgi:hypothetical protein
VLNDPLFWILVLPGLLLGLYAQGRIKLNFAKYSQVGTQGSACRVFDSPPGHYRGCGRTPFGAAPHDLDVYELTLRGGKHQFNPEATRAGRADLEEAIRRDPNYAPALAELARDPQTGKRFFMSDRLEPAI